MIEDTINRVKMQPTEWEEILANHISDKGQIFRKDRTSKTQQQKTNPITN